MRKYLTGNQIGVVLEVFRR